MASRKDNSSAATPSRATMPFNLTAAAEVMTWPEACRVIGVSGPSEAAALDITGVPQSENDQVNEGLQETLYVVVAGYGVLRGDGVELECTAGDLLFVPKGCAHYFERLDGEIKLWRICPRCQ